MKRRRTSIRMNIELADEAVGVLGVKSRTEAVRVALEEIVAIKRFKALMARKKGGLAFKGYDSGARHK